MTSDVEHLSLFFAIHIYFEGLPCGSAGKESKSMLLTTTLFILPQRPHYSAITRLENLGFYFWALVFSSHAYFIVRCEN